MDGSQTPALDLRRDVRDEIRQRLHTQIVLVPVTHGHRAFLGLALADDEHVWARSTQARSYVLPSFLTVELLLFRQNLPQAEITCLSKRLLSASVSGMAAPVKDRSHWPQAKLASFDEVRAYRIRQWQDAGCASRLAATWELVVDYWVGMKGKHPDELRLQRSIAHLRRRAG